MYHAFIFISYFMTDHIKRFNDYINIQENMHVEK